MDLYGICQLTLIPVRKEPSEASEMVNQLLYGDTFNILERDENWSRIISHFDNYEGWISTKMFKLLNSQELAKYKLQEQFILKEPFASLLSPETKSQITIIAGGSCLTKENFQNFAGNPHFFIHNSINLSEKLSPSEISKTATKYFNAPYLWGGRTIFGIDCSGLTQVVYKMNGKFIPRDANQQADLGIAIPFAKDAKPGDLAFFERADGYIVHTGIILEHSKIIHASGQVRIDSFDDEGIYNTEQKKYSHKLKIIKRLE